VRRLVAAVLACGLAVSSTAVSSLHVHDYTDHDHPDHHHGPASHEHAHPAIADRDDHSSADEDQPALEVESCDPGRHAISITMGCVHSPQVHAEVAELSAPTAKAPISATGSTTALTDVRVHGPPFDARIASRAPPVTPHA
jgi:hypothetical protein